MNAPLLLATNNPGKIKELQAILAPRECIPQAKLGINDAEETGKTFIENALIKARHASEQAQTPALADDSGLVIPALQGEPGIYSARYAGKGTNSQDNIERVLDRLKTQPDEGNMTDAYFYCAIVLIRHPEDPTPVIALGQLNGKIITTPTGTHGFGYDPIFYLPDHQCTLAECPSNLKNQISHRALALKQLKTLLA